MKMLFSVACALTLAACSYGGAEATDDPDPNGGTIGDANVEVQQFPAPSASQSLTNCLNATPAQPPRLGKSNDTIPNFSRPAKGVAFFDPGYGTCLIRATDHRAEPPQGFARNDYARRQPFNADNSAFFVYAFDGFWHLYDSNFTWVKQLPDLAGDAEPQWHPSNPDLLYYLPNFGTGMKIFELNVQTNAIRTAADLAPALTARWPNAAIAWTRSEGAPSADLRYWALMVEDAQFNTLGFVVWDMQEQRVVSFFDASERPDYISMSPTGNYVLVAWLNRIVVFNRDFSNRRDLPARIEHADIALGANGNDIYVAIDYNASGGPLVMFDLVTGERTELEPTYIAGSVTSVHFSGKGYGRPGWVLVSTYARERGSQQWLHEKIFAMELKANPRIVQLAHHHSLLNGVNTNLDYFREPHAAVSRDWTRVLFSSNWGNVNEVDIDAYMVRIPNDAIPQ